MNKEKFTWVPFYKELAEKLLEYKDNRKELVNFVYSNLSQYKTDYLKMENGEKITDIDPFSFFAIFNRGISKSNRISILKIVKQYFNVVSEIPFDFDGIPVVFNMQSFYFDWKQENIVNSCNDIWNLFEAVIKKTETVEFFFNKIILRNGIKNNLTMALFWVSPNDYLALDSANRKYFTGCNITLPKTIDFSSYSNLLNLIKTKMKNKELSETTFTEISYNAWKESNNNGSNNSESQGDTDMSNANDKIKHYTKLLQTNHNLILTGAPGTGKTHLAKEIASLLCFGCVKDENEMTDEDKKQIGFVQFHPSYDYTDFVEGLRPDPDNDGSKDVSFIRMDGVFKEFCKRTLSKQKITKGNFDDAYEKFIEEIIENEEFSLNTKSRNKKFMLSLNSKNSVCVTAIDGNSSMCITKERIKQYIETGKTNWYIYTEPIGDYIKRKYNIKVEQKVETNKKKKFVFIIDEINRGEISKIFGELFFSIDPGYRGEKGRVLTQYQNLVTEYDEHGNEDPFTKDKGGFYVPENVYIIGTMNDIDRSVESMDFAFRRRFAFDEVTAEQSQSMLSKDEAWKNKDSKIVKPDEATIKKIKNRMNNLNNVIEQIEGLSSAYHIGASYFLKLQNYDGDFEQLWKYHIKGLLFEYLRGNPDSYNLVNNTLKVAYDDDTEHNENKNAVLAEKQNDGSGDVAPANN